MEFMVIVVEAHTQSSRAIILQNRSEGKTIVFWIGESRRPLWPTQAITRCKAIGKGILVSETADTLMKNPVKLPVMLEK